MSDQSLPRTEPNPGDKPETQQKKPSCNGKPRKRPASRKSAARLESFGLAIEPLPKR